MYHLWCCNNIVYGHYINFLEKPQELTIGKGAKVHMRQRPKRPELIPVSLA